MFNAAEQEVVRTNTAVELAAFIDSQVPTWERFGDLPYRADGQQPILERILQDVKNPIDVIRSQDGAPLTNEIRKWRWNLITNYEFDEGALGGFNIGAAARWQDKVGIGYKVFNDANGAEQLDVGSPIFGGTNFNLDLWAGYKRTILKNDVEWNLQLNIRNALNDDDLIPVGANPDGSIHSWRIVEPIAFEISNSFRF
jgi:hypothetical protein